MVLEFLEAQPYFRGRNPALLKSVTSCLCLQPQGSVVCSCRASRWHGDSSSTHNPLMWCIGCPPPGVGSSSGLCEKRPERLGRCLPASQGQPTTRGQRAADPCLKTDWPLSPEPSPPGLQDS